MTVSLFRQWQSGGERVIAENGRSPNISGFSPDRWRQRSLPKGFQPCSNLDGLAVEKARHEITEKDPP